MRYEDCVRGLAVAWLTCLSLCPVRASAQAPREGGVVFSWVRMDGAESCPGRAELAAEVRRRLGYDPFEAPFGQSLEGVVSRTDVGWSVTLYNRSATGTMLGTRALESEERACAALAEAVTLAMALAIDPEAALRAPEPRPDPPPEAEPAPEPEPEAIEPPPPAPEEGHERVRLSLGAAGSYDLVPGIAAGVRLGVDGPLADALRWYGAVLFWPEQIATRDDASFGIGLTTFSLGLCAGAQLDWFRFDGCASVDAGAAHAVVYSPTPRAPGQRFYSGATGLARLEARLFAPVWLGVFGGVAVPFIVHAYRVQGRPGVVFQPSAVAPVVGAELAVRFR